MIMWLGELITQRGIGNGMSILIFTSVISRLPAEGTQILLHGRDRRSSSSILLLGLGIIVAVVFMEQGQRRIPVQYAKRVVGRRMTSGGSTYIPLKVNQAGVIPIIFASSVLYFPTLLASVIHASWFQNFVNSVRHEPGEPRLHGDVRRCWWCSSRTSTRRSRSSRPIRRTTSASRAGSSPASGPDRRPPNYLHGVLVRITLPGSLFLAAIALIPSIFLAYLGISIGSRSVARPMLITVGVALETMKQIESQLMMRHYEGFLR